MTEVAHGVIKIDVRDEEALAAMRRLGSEVERQMDSIGREKAEAKATLDTSDIDQQVKNAKRKLRELEGHKSTLKADGPDFKKVAAEIEALEKDLKRLDGKQASVHLKYKGEDERRKAINRIAALDAKEARIREQAQAKAERIAIQSAKRQAAAKRQIAAEERKIWLEERAAHRENARLDALSERARMADIQQRAKQSAALRSQEAREMAQAERQAYNEEAMRERAVIAAQKEADAVHDLRAEYIKTAREIEAYDVKRRAAVRSRDPLQVTQVDVNHQRAMAKLEQLRERLENIGEPPPVVDIHIQPGRRFGTDLRAAFQDRGVFAAGRHAGDRMLQGFRSRFNRETFSKATAVAVAGSALSRTFSKLGSVAAGLSQATVRIGPFTATIRQALVGLAALGPMIIDIVGALGALGGVLGSATAGLGALSAGFLGGAIPSAIGFFAVLKPVTAEFGNAMKASKAYNDALQKGNTSLAAKKQKELSKILGNVDERTKQNFLNASKLSDKWTELTKPARTSAFKVIGDALGYASDNVGMFADQTNKNFEVAGNAVQRWIRGMNTAEGRDILGSMMKNFRRTMGPVLDGIGNMGTYLGRVGKIASGFMPKLGRQFKNWSQSLADGAKGKEFEQKISRVVNSLKAVGRFALAGGRLMKAFFGGGVESGTKFLDTMTRAMNRWTAFLQTDEGRNKLETFFERSVSGVQALYSALAPVVRSFTMWASALSPVVSGFFRGAGAVANFVAKIMSLTALRGPITALVATLGALWAVGKITAATVALGNFTRALLGIRTASGALAVLSGGLGGAAGKTAALTRAQMASTVAASALGTRLGAVTAAQRGVATTSRAATIASIASAGALAKNANAGTKAAQTAGKAAKSTGFMAKAMAAGGGAARALSAAVGGAAGGVLLAAGAVAYFDEKGASSTSLGNMIERANNFYKMGDAARASAKGLNENAKQAPQIASQYRTAKMSLAQMKQQLDSTKKGTVEHQQALLAYRDQLRFTQDAEKQWTTVKRNAAKGAEHLATAERKRAEFLRQMRREGNGKQTDEQREKLAQYTAEVVKHKNIMATAPLNMKRAWEGLNPVLGAAQQKLGALARQAGGKKLAQKIAVKFEAPKDVGRVAAAAGRSLKAGVPKSVTTKIVADSKNAQAAVKALNRQTVKAKVMKIVSQGHNTAFKFLTRIQGTKLGDKVFRILARDTDAQTKYRQLRALGFPPKIARMLGDNKDALAKARQANATRLKSLWQVINRKIGSDESRRPVGDIIQRVVRKVVGGARRAGESLFAQGGVTPTARAAGGTGASPDPARIARAALEAEKRQVRDIRSGGKVTRPTLLVGEENRSEFVIATNPRYRERSIGLLRQAARALGIPGLVDEERDMRRALGEERRLGSGIIAAAAGTTGRLSKRQIKRKFVDTGKSKYLKQVQDLKAAEENHTRLAAIAESRIDEPETFLKDSGQKAPDGSPIMVLDAGVLGKYLSEMNVIRGLYQAVIQDLAQLNKVLPKAAAEQKSNVDSAQKNIDLIKGQITLQKRRRDNKKLHKNKRAHARKMIAWLEKKLPPHERAKESAETNLGEVREEQKDAPWRLMEAQARHAEYVEDMISVDRRAKDDAAQAAEAAKGSGSSSNLSYGQQVAASASEQATVLREFAANAVTATGGPTTGSNQATPAAARTVAAQTGAALGRSFAGAMPKGGGGSKGGGGKKSVSGAAIASMGSSDRSTTAAALGRSSASAGASRAAKASSGGSGYHGGGDKNITINNEFKTAPSDPHTWSKGIEFEIGAAL